MTPIEVPKDLGAYIQGKFMVQVGYTVFLFKMVASKMDLLKLDGLC